MQKESTNQSTTRVGIIQKTGSLRNKGFPFCSYERYSFFPEADSSFSTTLMIPFFHMIREEIIATGSINKIKKPTIPNREPPLVIRTKSANKATMISTGTTPAIPFFTTFLPDLVLENKPKVRDPNKAGIR